LSTGLQQTSIGRFAAHLPFQNLFECLLCLLKYAIVLLLVWPRLNALLNTTSPEQHSLLLLLLLLLLLFASAAST
jgi:hypothetical protein